ncbi:GerAB/ArcD/ProY family transporter [Paenibacillus sp. HB172176]|uniref:GerAB/ArcD/ProY family transporter n=1 Tax=Paenibacillus sp. HB172176 TaxID=2493690 RepID=UPI00143BE5CB|nr:GerAB/ArcD/ProY family transporter [Paenibacillus sp. HB172176]
MIRNVKIGKFQLVVMILLFEIGSTPLFELGIEAKQDSWLAMAAGAIIGGVFLWMLLTIQGRSPDADLPELYRQLFGKWLGFALALPQGFIFAYESMRNVRDFGELTVMTILNKTPEWSIKLLIISLAVYAIWKGAEVFFRLAELLFPIVLCSYLLIILLLFQAGLIDFHRLQPIMSDGIRPILHAAVPEIVSFPFAQMLTFLMFWKYIKPAAAAAKSTFSAYSIVSLFLVFMNMIIMSVLGPALAGYSMIPFLEVVQLIKLADFLERLDVVVTVLLIIGLFVKLSLLMLASVLALSALLKIPYKTCTVIIAPLIFGACFLEPNNTVHLWIGLKIVIRYVTPAQMAVLACAFLIGFFRRDKQPGNAA